MSSSEGECNRPGSVKAPKRRRRACDSCRKKRARCDGSDRPQIQCSVCMAQGLECTYVEESSRRVPSKKYIAGLENRLGELDQILRRLCPDENIYETWIESAVEEPLDEELSTPPFTKFPPLSIFRPGPIESITRLIRQSHSDMPSIPLDHMEEDDDIPLLFPCNLDTNRFYGKSSGKGIIHRALSMRNEYVGSSERPVLSKMREEFWTIRPWERKPEASDPRPSYVFPAPDLARDLVDLYFKHLNLYQPLLHRPTFERSVREGLHYGNEGFAEVYLLVCAIGARFSSDPRVRLDGVDSRHSAGWKWFNQVDAVKTSFLALPSLYEIQAYCLTITFIQSSTAPQSVWVLVGIALRLIQDVGFHRRKTAVPIVESELWKRAFWFLICMDRVLCLALGRPLAIQEEDFDIDMPIDCDDEYWEHPDPGKRFQQPPDKPALTTGFIKLLKLIKILSTCSKVLYPLNKTVAHLGIGGERWRSNIVPELDSALNKWLSSMPEHLRWDPNQPNDRFFHQSAMLYSMCYYTQIFIHRPFLPSPGKSTSGPFPSLAICTTAARSCIRVADAQLQRGGSPPPMLVQVSAFISAVILLFGIWDRKNTPMSRSTALDQSPDMEDVRKVLQILQTAEVIWGQAGKMVDILSGLSSVSKNPKNRLGKESTDAASEHLIPPDLCTVGTGDGMLEDTFNPANVPMVGRGDDALTFLHDLLAGTPGSEESIWNYALGGLPDPFSFDSSSASTFWGASHDTNVEQGGIVGTNHPPAETDYGSMVLMNMDGELQGSAAHDDMSGSSTEQHHAGVNGTSNGSEALDMWLNVPVAFGLEDCHNLMDMQQESR